MQALPSVSFTRACRDCGRTVCFSEEVITPSGMRIPLDSQTLKPHRCRTDEEYLISQCIEYVAGVNRKLQTAQLRIVRELKS
jgi:hypothetical protein